MYLNENIKRSGEKVFSYDFSRGIEKSRSGQIGKMVGAKNITSKNAPSISPVDNFYRRDFPNDAINVGSYLNLVYYNTPDGFYVNGEKKGDLLNGEKTFVEFDGGIFIFPDCVRYNVGMDIFEPLAKQLTAKIKISVVDESLCELSYIGDDGNIARDFERSGSIQISGSIDRIYDGYYKIEDRDFYKKCIYIKHANVENQPENQQFINISNCFPWLQGACVCKNRIVGFVDNKICVSAYNDPFSWCEFEGEDGSFEYYNTSDGGFCACDSIEDQAVFFTNKNIYKMYGDDADEFSIKLVSSYCGIDDDFGSAHANVKGNIYFMNKNSIMRFSGINCEELCRLDEENITDAKFYSYNGKLYFCYVADSGEHFCVLDVDVGVVYELEISNAAGFAEIYDNLCIVTKNEIIAIEGNKRELDGRYKRDEYVFSSFEFDEIYNGFENFSPASVKVRANVGNLGELNIYCMLGNDGKWTWVGKIEAGDKRLWEFKLPVKLTDSLRLKFEGKMDYEVEKIGVIFS